MAFTYDNIDHDRQIWSRDLLIVDRSYYSNENYLTTFDDFSKSRKWIMNLLRELCSIVMFKKDERFDWLYSFIIFRWLKLLLDNFRTLKLTQNFKQFIC